MSAQARFLTTPLIVAILMALWPILNPPAIIQEQLVIPASPTPPKDIKVATSAPVSLPRVSANLFGPSKKDVTPVLAANSPRGNADIKKPGPPSERVAKALSPPEKPSMELRGTFLNSRGAFACLREKSGKELFKKQGEQISGWLISGVSRDSVTLMKEGRSVQLGLFESPEANQSDASGSRYSLNQRAITFSRKELRESGISPSQIMSGVTIAPHVVNRKVAGFQLRNIQHPLLRKAGLQDGDIITSVQGTQLTSFSDAMKLAGKIRNRDTVKVSIQRDGKARELQYSLVD